MLRSGISFAFLVVSVSSQAANAPPAISVPDPNVPPCQAQDGHDCIFPFTYQGQTFYECTTYNSVNGAHWCATKTRRGEMSENDDCANFLDSFCYEQVLPPPLSCQTDYSGPDRDSYADCVFPFTYNGETHWKCAKWVWGGENQGALWCSTKTDRNGNHVNGQGYYGFCDCSTCDCTSDTLYYSDDAGAQSAPAPATAPGPQVN